MKSYLCPLTLLIVAVAALAAPAHAGDTTWPQWRGPHLDGSSDATDLPDKIGKDQNRLWTTVLPGGGNGTPIIWNDKIFVSTVDPQSKKLRAVCVSLTDGKILWQKEIGVGFAENKRNNVASPSAVTDGKLVWFHWATGDLAAFDLDGKPAWSRNLQKDHGPFHYNWIYGSSPLLYKGKMYVQVLHRDLPYDKAGSQDPSPSYLLAINPQTGEDLWKQTRPTDAMSETQEAYSTPTPVEVNGHTEIVLIGGDAVTGHDAENGKELWRYTGWNPTKIASWRLVPSVEAGEGILVACAPKGGPVMAIKAGAQGNLTDADLAWKSTTLTSDVCVPLFYKRQLYILDGDKHGPGMGTLSCVDPKTGKVKWFGAFGGKSVYRASPTAADGKIYCMSEAGDVVVASTDEFKVLSQAPLGGNPSRGTIAVVDGHVVVRSGDNLFAFGTRK